MQAVRSNPLPLPLPLPSASDFLRAAAALAPPMLQLDAQGQLSRAALALEQVGSVVNEVGAELCHQDINGQSLFLVFCCLEGLQTVR